MSRVSVSVITQGRTHGLEKESPKAGDDTSDVRV
jgi:hypothetical protein